MTREPDPLATALSAALRGEEGGAGADEARVREAFRVARDTGRRASRRTRRRDDWRPAPVRGRWRGSLRTTAFGVAATVLLGGVAVAASGNRAARGGNGRAGRRSNRPRAKGRKR
ncbi:hypothetical protein AB0D99_23430 [Streptomyces sp. NPDC047971]|uniref:hypothetical protein n=1 Tax=Streptomyces sp. NPDC047971 TaxID=3154499 RepID=UPI0033FCDC7E